MSTFKDRGIVIKSINAGESDRRVTLLLKEGGKVTVSARGAAKPKSKFAAATQPFAYCDFVIFNGGGFLSLAQSDVIESFYNIRDDFNRYCYGCFFLEMADKMILEQMPAKKILFLLLKALQALSRNVMPAGLVSAAYQFKFLQIEGFSPAISECTACGEGGVRYFSGEGAVCGDCGKGKSDMVKISQNELEVIRYILSSEVKGLFGFSAPDETAAALERAAGLFREINTECHFKSLDLML